MKFELSRLFSLLKLSNTNHKRNIIKGYYCSYLLHLLRITRHPNKITIFMSSDFKYK